jgi:hypothetical protein
VPDRDAGSYGTPNINAEHDQTATFVMLLPLSFTIEVPATREVKKCLVAGVGHPYLVLRLGTIDPADSTLPATPRLPTDQIIDRPFSRCRRTLSGAQAGDAGRIADDALG